MGIVGFFAPVGWVLGKVMYYINGVVHNYGLTLLIFSILVKVLMIPLGIKQQKGMVANARMQPKMQALQKAYGNNKQKYSEELQKLYNEEGFSPLSSCLPMLIQFPILFGMLDVIYSPIKHMLQLPADTIATAIEVAKNAGVAMNAYSSEISVLTAVQGDYYDLFVNSIGLEATNAIKNFDFTFLGLFLGDQPVYLPSEGMGLGLYFALLSIPVLSGLSSFLMSRVTKQTTSATTDGQMNSMSNTMMLMMPLMSIWISFIVPAGVGIYWLISNILSTVQAMVLNKVMNPAAEIAKAKAEAEALKEQERVERIEAKKKAREAGKDPNEKGLSQKEINRRKLAEARKRDAERYGDEYSEVTDDDVK